MSRKKKLLLKTSDSFRLTEDLPRPSIIKTDHSKISSSSSPKRVSPQKRPQLPKIETLDLDNINITDLLAKLNPYIEQNKLNLPAFSSSEEAKQELTKLQRQLQSSQGKSSIKSRRNDFSSKLAGITKQHQAIEEENEKIASFRQSAKEARENEEKEYNQIKQQIMSAKKKLNEAKAKKSNEDSQLNQLQTSIDTLEKTYTSISNQNEQLSATEKELQSTQRQINSELQGIETKNASCEREEATLDALDKATAEKMSKIRQLQKDLASKQAIISQIQSEIKKLSETAERVEIHYEDVLSKASAVDSYYSPQKSSFKSDNFDQTSDSFTSPYKISTKTPVKSNMSISVEKVEEEEEDYEALLSDHTKVSQIDNNEEDVLYSEISDDEAIENLKDRIKSFSNNQFVDQPSFEEDEEEDFIRDIYKSPIKSVSQQYSSILNSAMAEEEELNDDTEGEELEQRYKSALTDDFNDEEEDSENSIIREALRVVNSSIQDPNSIIGKY